MKERVAFVQNVPVDDHRMVYTDGVGRELSKRGYDVTVIVQKSEDECHCEDAPYRLVSLPGDTYSVRGQMVFCRHLLGFLRRDEYDIFHGKNPFSSVLPALALEKVGWKTKMVYDVRGLWVDFAAHAGKIPGAAASWLNKIDIFCMNSVDKVIAISHRLKDVLVSRGVEEGKVNVIVGDGVDLVKAEKVGKKDVREVFSFDGRVVGYVGSVGKARNSERIIEAFGLVRDLVDFDVCLVMVGPFSSRAEEKYFRRLVKKQGLEGLVFSVGLVSHDLALGFMRGFDVAVAYHEGDFPFFNVAVPTKILEYLATGRCVVASDNAMYRNVLTHGVDGFLTGQNPKEFAEGIVSVLKDEELAEKLSRNGRKMAEKYSFQKIADQIEKVYHAHVT